MTLLHAPSVPLIFRADGEVWGCFHWPGGILGRFPESSLEELWNRRTEREFSNGCSSCARMADFGPGTAFPEFPTTMEFELSNLCDIECVMCDGERSSAIRRNREGRPDMPQHYDREFVRQLRPFLRELKLARFSGGEPFLNEFYFELWDEFVRSGATAKILINSNGLVLNDKVKQVLKDLKPEITLSIDSVSEKNFERIRKGAKFAELMENVEYLLSLDPTPLIGVTVCLMRLNWQDIPGIVEFCNLRNLVVHFTDVHARDDLSLRTLPGGELAEIHRELSQARSLAPNPTDPRSVVNAKAFRELLARIRIWSRDLSLPEPVEPRAPEQVRVHASRETFCHAPSVNLNFEQAGLVTACCYNRRFPLGTYPVQTIDEIWHGPQVKALREALKKGDLSKGCNVCHEQVLAENFSGLRARFFDSFALNADGRTREPESFRFPRAMEFELSNACNLECVMCDGIHSSAIRKNREHLPPYPRNYDSRFVRQLDPYLPHLELATFFGGEPFLNGLYFEIWERIIAHNSGTRINITTNGSILNERVKGILEALKPDLMVSIDSLDERNYEQIRKGASYRRLRDHLEYFLARGNRRISGVAVCPMIMNWQDLPAIVDFCNVNDLVIYFNAVYHPPELSLRRMPQAELEKVYEALSDAACLKPEPRFMHGDRNASAFRDLLLQIASWCGRLEPLRSSKALLTAPLIQSPVIS